MKSPSQYPVLDNRPIDQWKVMELKEELKRRRLTTKGLKDDLIKRLDEALCAEIEDAQEVDNGIDDHKPEIVNEVTKTEVAVVEFVEAGTTIPVNAEEAMGNDDGKSFKVDIVSVQEDIKDSDEQASQDKILEEKNPELAKDQSTRVEILSATDAPSVGAGDNVCESLLSETVMGEQGLQDDKMERGNEDSMAQQGAEDVKLSNVDLKPDTSDPTNQDVEEPHENRVSVEETENNVTNADSSRKNHSTNLGSSEKLNLDRSSGDDSMEEDALESKQIDLNFNSEEGGDRTKKSEVSNIKEEGPFTAMDTDVAAEEKSIPRNRGVVAASSDKRKFPEQEAVPNNEPSKRQRRWKSESNQFRESQISSIPPFAAAKDVLEPAFLKRNFSRSDSVGTNDVPKEREVPPSAKAATSSLRIDRFLRPFTLKAAQELLAKTGTVTSFWMDHIKTHCYVTYSSAEEAIESRNAVYNLQWPPNGGHNLVAEFVDPEEVKSRVEAPSSQPRAAPVSTGPTIAPEPPTSLPQRSPRQQNLKQQMSQQLTLPPPPPLTNPSQARELALPPPPPQEKVDAPILTLDDLFRKTKATPRIYYLPLSEEQVSAILEERRKNSRQ